MLELYTGVTYTFPIMKGDVNALLKEIVEIASKELDNNVNASMHRANYAMEELEIKDGDYYFEVFTRGLDESWTDEKLRDVALKIKKITNSKIGFQVHGPYEIEVNGETFVETGTLDGMLSQEEIEEMLEGNKK